MTYHVFEGEYSDGQNEDCYMLYIHTVEKNVDTFYDKYVEICDSYCLGTVQANSSEEAMSKVVHGEWEYTQKI
jgi:hypothetical protein